MPRNMSFFLTTPQILAGTKTVTRRARWWMLRSGDIINAVEKCQGLKKDEKMVKLRQIQIVSTTAEHLKDISAADLAREGFPEMSKGEFIKMFCNSHKGITKDSIINRIEFKYI